VIGRRRRASRSARKSPVAPGDDALAEQPLLQHLLEFRSRVLWIVLVVAGVFLGLFPVDNELFYWLSKPLQAALPPGANMIAMQVATPFMVPMKLALYVAIFISVPYILYHLWAFIGPALYQREKRMMLPLLVSSSVLFYLGTAFAYFLVFPMIFRFFVATTPHGVVMMTDIGEYLNFVMTLFMAFGATFEVPIAIILVVWTGMVSRRQLASARPYVIVAAFILGMVLTPPSVVAQLLLAIPIWALFEAGLFAARWFESNPDPLPADEAQGS